MNQREEFERFQKEVDARGEMAERLKQIADNTERIIETSRKSDKEIKNRKRRSEDREGGDSSDR